jgi:putative phage-type endonuclease
MSNQLIQGSKEWLQMRRSHIGASDAPVIMGVSPWKTAYQLWEEKCGLSGEQETTSAMKYGHDMEEPARRAYEKHTGNLVFPTVIFHPEKKFMVASLDGISFDGNISVEIKNVKEEDHEEAKSGKIPAKYFPQVQHQLACLGHKLLHYFSFRKGDFALVEVERDEEYIQKLYELEGKFWEDVQTLREPKLSEKDYTIIETYESITMASEWKSINQQLKELEEKEKKYRKQLIELAGNKNARIGDIKLTKSIRKGTVDYGKIIELEGVNLEQYRKEPVIAWRVS